MGERNTCLWPFESLKPMWLFAAILVFLPACGGRGTQQSATKSTDAAATTTTAVAPPATGATPATQSLPSVQSTTTTASPANIYLVLIAPVNTVVAMFDADTDPTAKLHDLEELSGLLGLFANEVQGTTWPTEAQNEITGLLAATHATEMADNQLISDPTTATASEFSSAVSTLSTRSSEVRVVLGLPPLG